MRGQCWMPCNMDSGWWNFRILNFNVFFQIYEFSNVFLFFRIFEFLNFRVVFQFFEFSNFQIFEFSCFFFNFLNFRIFEFSNFRGKPCRTHGIGTSQKKMPQYRYVYGTHIQLHIHTQYILYIVFGGPFCGSDFDACTTSCPETIRQTEARGTENLWEIWRFVRINHSNPPYRGSEIKSEDFFCGPHCSLFHVRRNIQTSKQKSSPVNKHIKDRKDIKLNTHRASISPTSKHIQHWRALTP